MHLLLNSRVPILLNANSHWSGSTEKMLLLFSSLYLYLHNIFLSLDKEMHSNQDSGQNDCYHDNSSHGNDDILPGLRRDSRTQHLKCNHIIFIALWFLFSLPSWHAHAMVLGQPLLVNPDNSLEDIAVYSFSRASFRVTMNNKYNKMLNL